MCSFFPNSQGPSEAFSLDVHLREYCERIMWKNCVKRLLPQEDSSKSELIQPCWLRILSLGEIIQVLTCSKWWQNGKVSIQEMLADLFWFQRHFCHEVSNWRRVKILKTTFHSASCTFLINGNKGSLDTRFSPLFVPCVLQCGWKSNVFFFYGTQRQTRWVFRNHGTLICLKFSKYHAFWYLV